MYTKRYTLKRVSNLNQPAVKSVDESQFIINYKEKLNKAQFEAVSSVEGAYLIIAGAGTGKTRTLVYRVARLIELGYDPKSILMLTFTRKAANEMMNRASVLLDNRCSRIIGGTFHSFANLNLRKYAKMNGLDSSFTILDQSDSEDVINLIRSQAGFVSKEKRFPNKQTLAKVYSLSVNTSRNIDDIINEEYPHFKDYIDKILAINKIFSEYKKKNNLLDYDDLLVYLRNFLLENGPGARSLLSSIKFVMVDEYQDSNKLQADIIRGLAQHNNNIMVVGDDSQSIYSFRGASFKNIMEFPKIFKDVKIILLEENYRSLDNFLSDMAIEPIIDSVVDITGQGKEDEFVTLSTIHSAKGLEWHSVFIINAVEGLFPSSRSSDKLETLEEERRLMYVASTRAKQNLFITYPMNMFDRESGKTLSKPSRFISDIKNDLVEGWLLEEDF